MRRSLILTAAVVLVVIAALPVAAAAPPVVTVEELLADPAAYAAPEVPAITVRGELVGDFGRRSGGVVWTQLNGDAYVDAPLLEGGDLVGRNAGIGMRIPADAWPDLDDPGGYRLRGPVVVVTGAWRYHDPGRGGESYLDVMTLVVERSAQPLHDHFDWVVCGLGAVLVVAAAVVWSRNRAGLRGH